MNGIISPLDDRLTKELIIKFLRTFERQPNSDVRQQGIERFRSTGGQMPEGVELRGRWTKADRSGGVDLLETDDPKSLAAFAYQCERSHAAENHAVVEDQERAKVFSPKS